MKATSSGLDRGVRTGCSHRDAHRRARQCRSIVDAVADHRRRRLGGEFGDDACLVLWTQLGAHVVDSGDFSQRPRGASVVAGEHAHFHAVGAQGLHDLGYLGPQLVADPDRPGEGVIDGDKDAGLALGLHALNVCL